MHEDKAQGVGNRVQWPGRTTKVISFHSPESLGTLGKGSIMLSSLPPSFVCTHLLELSFSIPSSKLLLILQRPSSIAPPFQTSTDHSLSSHIYSTHT